MAIKKLLLINKHVEPVEVQLSDIASETTFIDVDTIDKIEMKKLDDNKVKLGGFAVHVILF